MLVYIETFRSVLRTPIICSRMSPMFSREKIFSSYLTQILFFYLMLVGLQKGSYLKFKTTFEK